MSFTTDKQTLDDLNLTGKFKPGSVFSLFNKVHTKGGGRLLETMFQQPLTNHELINERSSIFSYFQQKQLDFPLDKKQFEEAENYLGGSISANPVIAGCGNLVNKIKASVIADQQYQIARAGFTAATGILKTCKTFFGELHGADSPFSTQVELANNILKSNRIDRISRDTGPYRLSLFEFTRYDYLLRSVMKDELQTLITIIHQVDVYIAVSKVASINNYVYANAFPENHHLFKAEELRHPALKNAVGNNLWLNQQGNVIFLTGANMAGKSTLMKTIGISFYLAHIGFPVAAKSMGFSVKEGVYSSINVPDNLNMGYSHFYAEVLRVKTVAQEVAAGKDMLVIFDELFKGTNVKDAYDATLAVTEAFAMYRNCFFVISTHIIEVGDALKNKCSNFQFKYLPATLKNNLPRYSYKIKDGITDDRQGMIIIKNEGLLELIASKNSTVKFPVNNN